MIGERPGPDRSCRSGWAAGEVDTPSYSLVDRYRTGYTAPLLTENTYVLLDALERIARDLDTTVARASLAWVRQQRPVTSVLIVARTLAQLEDNLA